MAAQPEEAPVARAALGLALAGQVVARADQRAAAAVLETAVAVGGDGGLELVTGQLGLAAEKRALGLADAGEILAQARFV